MCKVINANKAEKPTNSLAMFKFYEEFDIRGEDPQDIRQVFEGFKRSFGSAIKDVFKITSEDLEELGLGSLWLYDFGANLELKYDQEGVHLTITM